MVEVTDEEGDTEQIPVTHALFIRDSEVATLPQAPYHRREKCDPNETGSVYAHLGGTAIKRKSKSLKLGWRKRRSISRVVFGRKEARVIRLSDSSVGFGRRKSPTPGAPQKLFLIRKKEQLVTMTPTPAGTACPAHEIVSRKMHRSLATRQSIRKMVKEAIKDDFPPR
ncbi:MAG: hypothetical protein ACKPKO_02370, partial [Candidatus Fonsibacter sp.]